MTAPKLLAKARQRKSEKNKPTTPYMRTDPRIALQKVEDFKRLLPNVEVFYAVKANPDVELLKAIDSAVVGYDIASVGELKDLQKSGIDVSRMMYSNPVKIPQHIEEAYKRGVRLFSFDSFSEIQKIAKYAPGSSVYLRLTVSDYGSKFPLSKKFGLDPLHAVDYCLVARDAGLQVKGVTFHVGSQSENVHIWRSALEIAGKTIQDLGQHGMDIEFLDLGGGFPADYGEPIPSLSEISQVINQGVHDYIPNTVRLIAEPGRYISANTSTIVTTIIGREHRSGSDWLYLDVGAFHGIIEPLEMPGWKYPIATDKDNSAFNRSFVLTGPTCDANDTIGSDYVLPATMNVGDKIYIQAAGAYTTVYATSFNGFTPLEIYYGPQERYNG